MVFALTMPAAAHDLCCHDCGKCDLGDILCPVGSTAVNATGTCTAYWFDYDEVSSDDMGTALKTGARGYDTQNAGCKVVFDICCCTDSLEYFVSDNTIGIRMTSMTDGFYFTSDQIYFDPYNDLTSACLPQVMGDPRAFGTNTTYEYFWDRARMSSCPYPAPKDDDCNFTYKPYVVQTPCGEGYVIQNTDINDAFCWWWIDMPAMKYDKEIAVPCSEVLVKIELLSAVNPGTICDECAAICECIVNLGTYCCVTPPEPDECCVLFPYVLVKNLVLDSNWATGITLINLAPTSVAYGDMEVAFTLVDKNGVEYTYTKTDFASDQYVWTFTLDSGPVGILPFFSGMPVMGACYLKATANFMINGYMFISNGNYAGGTYATDCFSPCSCSANK
jgi:hypothetical protein